MQSKTFGKLGWSVSAVGLGTWNIGNQWGAIDDATAWATIRTAYEHGVTVFDTAESYGIPHGLSEMRLGTALAGIRHNVHIVSKIGSWGNRTGASVPRTGIDSIRLSGHAILGRLRTDYLDVVLCHEGNLEDPTIYLEGFEALKTEGAIRAYGISTNDVEVLKRFNVNGTCSVAQTDYSLDAALPAELPASVIQVTKVNHHRLTIAADKSAGSATIPTKFSALGDRWTTAPLTTVVAVRL